LLRTASHEGPKLARREYFWNDYTGGLNYVPGADVLSRPKLRSGPTVSTCLRAGAKHPTLEKSDDIMMDR
jgi:hypothetical protein